MECRRINKKLKTSSINFINHQKTTIMKTISKSLSLGIALLLSVSISSYAQNQSSEKIYRNRLGGIIIPGGSATDYERFLSDKQRVSIGVTIGTFQDAGDLTNANGSYKVDLYAVNPFVRYYFWKPRNWFNMGVDVKPSLVLIDMERDLKGIEFFPAVESHLVFSFQHKRFYGLLGVGAKQFLDSRQIPVSDGTVLAPKEKTLSSGELSIGYRFNWK
jgi:hypothetical protein